MVDFFKPREIKDCNAFGDLSKVTGKQAAEARLAQGPLMPQPILCPWHHTALSQRQAATDRQAYISPSHTLLYKEQEYKI